ncbi:MAG TPA: NAD-dependent epimerase/dehydratase family protein [Candidatus Syntrophosphaera sp.]|jgi:UDP-glucose 4-epimerase|nr:NAD-dependent epimerase/dehydratase family protein [Candidatus Cloacimonadota bacterium]HOR03838.1 NAD-dependent epimerase/dehydratase family protein [Candidatus Syntrophosphaera sp.]HQG94222.1 NAD-dependent epimerase/dehydratase family protein [Candidatus Syntrophosphaera sp.]HQK29652.1 NAD-dependent epimerase/dehydratase family protein [Candidatus Syntrophosphaera sp.]HQO68232.1 NAD-dependent epimerase/dehydratase family protein [Candidatus Syntrophosphaera sp.]
MKILITGGAGFIGSHVADACLEAGHQVVVVDDLSSGNFANLNPAVKFYQLDIRDPALDEVFAAEKPDVVNHHAAQISVPRSVTEPLLDAQINILGLVNVLENCVKHHIKKVIFISTGGAIYGEAEEYPTTEDYPPQPLSVYAINKFAGENYLRFYQHQYGLEYTVLRYANVFGPRQIAQGEAGVVSIFVEKLLQDSAPTIYAYPDAPEGMIRDYVYVKDVVRANLAVLDRGSNEVFNIGTCEETTTSQLYKTILWQLGKKIQPLKGPARKGDLRRSMLDNSKAFKELGWSPIYSLEDGIRETVTWFKVRKEKS